MLKLISKEWLYEQYWIKGLTTAEIAKKLGYKGGSSVYRKMRAYGLNCRDKTNANPIVRQIKNALSKEMLNQLYWIEEKSCYEIARMFNVSGMTVLNHMTKLGIKKRTRSERKQK